jgi:hypothetical protein
VIVLHRSTGRSGVPLYPAVKRMRADTQTLRHISDGIPALRERRAEDDERD